MNTYTSTIQRNENILIQQDKTKICYKPSTTSSMDI